MATVNDGTSDAKNTLDLGPRPEAGAFSYESLTEQQRGAFDRALRFVHGIAKRPWKPRETHDSGQDAELDLFLPVIEPLRGNHVLLIDGGRGSGKTSVLLSLLQAWSEAVRGKVAAVPEDVEVPVYDRGMLMPHGSIVPLALIDLQPLPASTSLMLHVAGPLQRVVEAMERRAVAAKPTRWEPNASMELDARQSWRRFAQAVALGWDENVRERAKLVDPDTYAAELEQAERKRLDVRDCFSRFVDDVAREYQAWRRLSIPPLFVLAFDDADMSPELSVELLRLLSTLRHARLVFVATGDSQLFLTSLRRHYLGALRRVVGTHSAVSEKDLERLGDDEEPVQLAHQVYDKVIPSGQRLMLEDLAREKRLSFCEKAYGQDASKLSVETLLSDISINPMFEDKVVRKGDPTTLLGHFRLDPQICEALPGNIRRLVELQRKLRDVIVGCSDGLVAERILMCLWLDAVSVSGLLPSDNKILANCVTLEPLVGSVVVGGSSLSFSALSMSLAHPFTTAGRRAQHKPRRLVAWGSYYHRNKVEVRLPSQVTACLMLAANFAASNGMFRLRSPIKTNSYNDSYFVLNSGHKLVFPWPLPIWESFLDAKMAAATPPLHGGNADSPEAFSQHVKVLLWTIALVGVGSEKDGLQRKKRLSWIEVAEAVYKLTSTSLRMHYRRRKRLSNWAKSSAGLFACPEFGLSALDAGELLAALAAAFGKEWHQVRLELIAKREGRMNTAIKRVEGLAATAASVFEELSQEYPGHPGNDLVKKPIGSTPLGS